MATLEELQSRLAMLHESLDELRGLIKRLGAGVQTTGSQEADDLLDEEAVTDLAAEIADGLRDAHDEQELLQEDLADLGTTAAAAATTTTTAPEGTSHDRARLRAGLARLDQELQTYHAAFRKARLQAQQSLEKVQRRERQAVLAAYAYEEEEEEEEEDEVEEENERDDHLRGVRHHPRASSAARRSPPTATAAAAADVTAALRQTHARIAGEVARSDFAAQTLAESSRALTELGDRYGGGGGNSQTGGGADIASSLQSARHLVRGLVAAHKSDTWYLQTALYLLLATVAWLLFRRLLYGPLWLLVWWPVRTAWATAATAVGLGRAGAGLLAHDAPGNSFVAGSSSISLLATPSTHTTSSPLVRADTSTATPSTSSNTKTSTAPESDSLVEQVGQIVDGHGNNAEEQPTTQEEAPADAENTPADSQDSHDAPQRNPMKRMWEEDVEAAKYEEQQKEQEKEHTRDEL